MKAMTAEWVSKAEGDFAMVERESRARRNPCYDGLCFHAQQCAEKYLKALLCEADVPFPRSHDLVALLDLLLPSASKWESRRDDLAFLSAFAVAFRYPGDSTEKQTARDARRRCARIRLAARETLLMEQQQSDLPGTC